MAGHAYDNRSQEGNALKTEAPRHGGRLRSIRVEAAENGFKVSTEHEPPAPKKGKGGPEPMHWTPPKEMVFTSHEEATRHVGSHLAAHAAAHHMKKRGKR